MRVIDINPHIRFAEQIHFKSRKAQFNVFDCRIFCIISGEMKIEIDSCNYNLYQNDLFYCIGGSVYTISCQEGCELICINFDFSQERSNITESRAPLKISSPNHIRYKLQNKIDDCEILNNHIFIRDNYTINSKIKELTEEFNNKQIFFREKASAVLKEILIDMYRNELKKSENSLDTVEKVIAYINSNYHRKIVNSDLAKLTGYHEYYLNRIFKKQTGGTIHKYVMEVRINEAKKLIMTTDMPIYIIAQKTGFNSDTHLSNCFKNYFGYSPIEYKNNFKNRI